MGLESLAKSYASLVLLAERKVEESIDTVTAELKDALDAEKGSSLEEIAEMLAPVVEQDVDVNSALGASYGVGVEYGEVKSPAYYRGVDDVDMRDDYRAELKAEHEFYEELQDINRQVIEASMSGRSPTEVQLDAHSVHAKESMKIRSNTEFQFMYGKLNWDFN